MVADCIAGSPGVFFLSSAYFYGWEIHIATDILLEVFLYLLKNPKQVK